MLEGNSKEDVEYQGGAEHQVPRTSPLTAKGLGLYVRTETDPPRDALYLKPTRLTQAGSPLRSGPSSPAKSPVIHIPRPTPWQMSKQHITMRQEEKTAAGGKNSFGTTSITSKRPVVGSTPRSQEKQTTIAT